MPSLVSIRTDDDLLGRFTSPAEATGRSRSFLINQAMHEFIECEAWQIAAIQKALEEADAGDFAADEKIAALDAGWGYHAGWMASCRPA